MNSVHCKRSWVSIFVSAIAPFLLLHIPVTASTTPANSNTSKPDVIVLITAANQGANMVSISYPTVVDKAVAQADLQRVAAAAKWNPVNVSITNEGTMQSGPANPMTSVEFMTPQTVDLNSGVLNIEPIITALKRFQHIQIFYFVPKTFQFKGWDKYENSFVKIGLNHDRDTGTYQYDILIKSSTFSVLGLPLLGEKKETSAQTRQGTSPLAIIFVIIIAIAAAVLVYIVTDRMNRNRRPSSRRS